MFRHAGTLTVELNTPAGQVFTGTVDGLELRNLDGVIAITPLDGSYFNLKETTRITARVGSEFFSFRVENAAASLREGHLTVLAESIQLISSGPENGIPMNGASRH